ncbi:hypothetical protein JCM3775_005569 [Rhodotorula graminis]
MPDTRSNTQQLSNPSPFLPGKRTTPARVLDKPLPPRPDEKTHGSSATALAGRGTRRRKEGEPRNEEHPQASSGGSRRYESNPSTSTPRLVSLPKSGLHGMERPAVRYTGPVKPRKPVEVGTIPIRLDDDDEREGDIPVMLDLAPEVLDRHLVSGQRNRRTSAVERRRE